MIQGTEKLRWLITGASRGLGYSMTEYLLKQGDIVYATSRNTEPLKELELAHPEQCFVFKLDVSDGVQAQTTVDLISKDYGTIDILVNNAGYGLLGASEECSEEQIHDQFQTNFFGLERLCRLVMPVMRKQQSGKIINVSSIAGIHSTPAFSYYNASKYAVEGYSEALAGEVKGFGIDVILIEPGPYRTDWAGPSLIRAQSLAQQDKESPYKPLNQEMHQRYLIRHGTQPGDPDQIARLCFDLSRMAKPPLRVVCGDIAATLLRKKIKLLQDQTTTRVLSDTQISLTENGQ